jgi:hypothetical protein
MNYRVATNLAGTVRADTREREFLPHLVCSWTIDPTSRRLSCAWAAPTEHWDLAVASARLVTGRTGPALRQRRV